jgi:hypothetical protein
LTAKFLGLTSATQVETVEAAAGKIKFVRQPTSGPPGALGPVTVRIRDQFGNPVNQPGILVTLGVAGGSNVLTGTLTVATDALGRATFSELKLDVAGTFRLEATTTDLPFALSNSFTLALRRRGRWR